MAIAADVPIVPHIVWGAQRLDQGSSEEHVAAQGADHGGRRRADHADAARDRADRAAALAHAAPLEQVQDDYGPHPPGEFWVPHRLGGGAPTLAEANRMDADEAAGEGGPTRAARRPGGSVGLKMEPVFRTLEIACSTGVGRIGDPHHLSRTGEHPGQRGAVIAINHTSYLDWMPAAMAAYKRHRRLRFMIKQEMAEVKIVNF